MTPGRLTFLLILVASLPALSAQDVSPPRGTRFALSFSRDVRNQATTGRVFVMLSRSAQREPRLQVGRMGVPFFGLDVTELRPGEEVVLDESALGSPTERLASIPPGDYFVQALLNVYSRFDRADGHVVWMHDDQWEGQHWRVSPGNGTSDVKSIHLDPQQDQVIHLSINHRIPPRPFPADTPWVKRFRMQSPLLTRFWGRPIWLGATVLLPRGYDQHPNLRYPVVYKQGHFSTRSPQEHGPGSDWRSDDFPRVLMVTFQHPNPYFDDSYVVNSVNVGPYGDAVLGELIPEIERRFRTIPEPWARVTTGGSTGGWESLALQVWHPDFFGGAFAFAPDPVDFRNVEGINIYSDKNAFWKIHEWRKVPIANTRDHHTGEVMLTSYQRQLFEAASANHGRSGEQFDIWSAVFGPLGKDGYFQPLFNKRTGQIDPKVATYWREHFDIRHYLEQNWANVGPKLVGKIHVFCGRMDNYYLNVGVYHLEEFLESTRAPYYGGSFSYGGRGGHGWRPMSPGQLIRLLANHMARSAPPDSNTGSWKD